MLVHMDCVIFLIDPVNWENELFWFISNTLITFTSGVGMWSDKHTASTLDSSLVSNLNTQGNREWIGLEQVGRQHRQCFRVNGNSDFSSELNVLSPTFASDSQTVLTLFSSESIESATRFYGDCCDPQHNKLGVTPFQPRKESAVVVFSSRTYGGLLSQSPREARGHTHTHLH